MKSVWQHLIETIIFFAILAVIYTVLNSISLDFNPIVPAIILIILWTGVNMRINDKKKDVEKE